MSSVQPCATNCSYVAPAAFAVICLGAGTLRIAGFGTTGGAGGALGVGAGAGAATCGAAAVTGFAPAGNVAPPKPTAVVSTSVAMRSPSPTSATATGLRYTPGVPFGTSLLPATEPNTWM